MIEILIALFLKFWMFLFGTIRGTISAVPLVRRFRLSGNLESELRGGQLVLHAERRDLLLSCLRVFAVEGTRIVPLETGELLLAAGETRQIALPEGTRACVLMTDLVDLGSGRHTKVHRRIRPEGEVKRGLFR